MKIGSLIVYKGFKLTEADAKIVARGGKVPEKGIIYTARDVYRGEGRLKYVLLEEIRNPINPKTKREYAYWTSVFKEVQPPMDITELIKEYELTTVEVCGQI